MKKPSFIMILIASLIILQACTAPPVSAPVEPAEAEQSQAAVEAAMTESPPEAAEPQKTEQPQETAEVMPAKTEVPLEMSPETIKLKVQIVPYFSYAPLYIAQEEGYFAEQGLEVEFQQMQGGTAFVALVQGDIDVAASFLSSTTLSAIYRGETVKIVADKGYVDPTGCTVNGLLARRDLVESGELTDAADLAGLKLKFDKVSVQAYAMDKLLSSGGLSFEDIEQVDFDSSAVVLEAFATGAVDMAVESEPWVTRNLNTGDSLVWKDFKDLIPDSQFAHIIFGPNLLEKNPEAGRRFMVAYLKATRQYNEGKTDRNRALMEAFTDLNPDLVQQLCWPTFRNDLLINTQSVLDFQDWAIENGLLDAAVTVEQFWDPSYAEYALDIVGR